MEQTSITSRRKNDHIRISLEEDVSFDKLTTGLEHYRFIHQALPELDFDDLDTATRLLGRELAFPLLISSMTGGTARGARINQMLAEAAQAVGIGMGLGSMRVILEQPATIGTFDVRKYAPDILLLANLGAVQLNYGYGPDDCRRIVEQVEADGVYLHLNPLQEVLQPEGDTRFSGLLHRIEAVCEAVEVPVVIKEVGWGLSPQAGRQLADAGVAALEVAGAGGTSWSQVEMYRSENVIQREVAAVFRDWGIPTAESLQALRAELPQMCLIASGGLQTGLDIAKSIALGAEATAMAGVLLHAVAQSSQALYDQLVILERQLRVTMFAAGAANIEALRQIPLQRIVHRR